MTGTTFCTYQTPCGWCTKFDTECTEENKINVRLDCDSEVIKSMLIDDKIVDIKREPAVEG